MLHADLSMSDMVSIIKGMDVPQYKRDRMISAMINKPSHIPNVMALILIIAHEA